MSDRTWWGWLVAICVLATLLRSLFPAADPPWRSTVGVVWHDEGAWTHNARNKALYGAWVQDEWNPVYIAPVFTGLEYASFAAFGVGLRQARLVSEAAGVISVLLLALGIRRIAGNAAGAIAGALVAVNYVYVMYDRAALMEALMAAFIVASWYCATRSEREPVFGGLAGVLAALAFFTKAAAAAYVGALGLVAVAGVFYPPQGLPPQGLPPRGLPPRGLPPKGGSSLRSGGSAWHKGNIWILGGLAISFAVVAILFVIPHWSDYQFYNWQVSVTRKPSYTLTALLQRLTWFPVLHDTFSRSWVELLLTILGAWAAASRWRTASSGERLLMLWMVVGTVELLVHDVSNERRFVFLLPAMAGFAALALARRTLDLGEDERRSGPLLWLATPAVFYSWYIVAAPLVRLMFLADVRDGKLSETVRLSALAACIGGSLTMFALRRAGRLSVFMRPGGAMALVALLLCWNVYQFTDYVVHRTYKNYQSMLELGRALPPDTVVQGKLANGLALENRIRPLFIGHGFGNYASRKDRWDVRYILTYTDPEIGHEGSQIVDVLAAYPGWRINMTFPVAETPSGHDTAALIEKRARH